MLKSVSAFISVFFTITTCKIIIKKCGWDDNACNSIGAWPNFLVWSHAVILVFPLLQKKKKTRKSQPMITFCAGTTEYDKSTFIIMGPNIIFKVVTLWVSQALTYYVPVSHSQCALEINCDDLEAWLVQGALSKWQGYLSFIAWWMWT